LILKLYLLQSALKGNNSCKAYQRVHFHARVPQALASFKKYMSPSSSLPQGKYLPFSHSPLRLNIFRLFVILSLTQLYRYTPELFLFSTATFNYTFRVPLIRIGQEYSASVAWSTFQSLKRIQPLPVCAGFFICIRNSLDRPCVTMPSRSSPLKCKVSL
jgi:hypothetical protein